ncbi:MAG: hypothetical protein ACO20H_09595 [Bacteriovoracaceae bacterium]
MENGDGKFEYQGHKIPLVIKIVWSILIVWLIVYLVSYLGPDLKIWLNK